MSKYKVNVNKETPSDEQINESKDFHKLIDSYSDLHRPDKVVKTIHRNKKLVRLAILLIVILLTLLFSQDFFEVNNGIDIQKTDSTQTTQQNE